MNETNAPRQLVGDIPPPAAVDHQKHEGDPSVTKRPRQIALAILLSVPGCAATPAHAAPNFPDRGKAAVIDAANVLPDDQERALNERIVAWVRSSGHQLAIATVPNLGGVHIKTYGYQLGRRWGLGDAQAKDGVILLLAPTERKVRIEVGYGLEPVLTDAATSAIVRDVVVPRLRDDDIPGALAGGADAIMAAATAETVQPMTVVDRQSARTWSLWWLALPTGLIAMIAVMRVYRRRRSDWREAEATAAVARDAAAREARRAKIDAGRPARDRPVTLSAAAAFPLRPVPAAPSTFMKSRAAVPSPSPVVPAPAYVPPVYEAPRRREEETRPSSYSSDWGSPSSPSSSDSGSSSSGYDSGGGSFGGGGADGSY